MRFVKLGMGVLTASMLLSTATPVVAAPKTSVYVVTHYKGDGTFFPDKTVTYDKSGLIHQIKQKGILEPDTYKGEYLYNNDWNTVYSYKKNKISKIVSTDETFVDTSTPTYKGGKVKTLKTVEKAGSDTSTITHQYAYTKGQITKETIKQKSEKAIVHKYKYNKKGQLIYDGASDRTYKYDGKGYVSYYSPMLVENEYVSVYFRNVYNSKKLLTATYIKKFKKTKRAVPKAAVLKVTYKKIKVSRSVLKKVKAQQNWFLKNGQEDAIYNI